MKKGSLLDEFEAKARRNTGKPATFLTTNGWKFGLSLGPVPMPKKEEWDALAPRVLKKLGIRAATPTREEVEAISDTSPLRDQWILSASLFPPGRSSSEKDWVFLGSVVKAVGARMEHLCTPFESTDPNDVHYWIWNDGDVP
jgi:hypothetical protein